MSITSLIREHCTDDTERAETWNRTLVELKVVLAYCNGVLTSAEHTVLSLLSVDSNENATTITQLSQSIEEHGFAQAADRVLRKLDYLLHAEKPDVKTKLATEIMRESINTALADKNMSDDERDFLCDRLSPCLGVIPQTTADMLRRTTGRLARERAYAERGFEIYLMLTSLSDKPPQLISARGEVLPGVLGAIDAFVEKHNVGSSRVVAYFISVMAGVFWIDSYEHHISELRNTLFAAREIERQTGKEGRLRDIRHELMQLRNRGVDASAFRAVARHVLNSLERMDPLNQQQYDLLKDHVATAIELNSDLVRRWDFRTDSRNGESTDGNCSRTGSHEGSKEPQSIHWWRFWR